MKIDICFFDESWIKKLFSAFGLGKSTLPIKKLTKKYCNIFLRLDGVYGTIITIKWPTIGFTTDFINRKGNRVIV